MEKATVTMRTSLSADQMRTFRTAMRLIRTAKDYMESATINLMAARYKSGNKNSAMHDILSSGGLGKALRCNEEKDVRFVPCGKSRHAHGCCV